MYFNLKSTKANFKANSESVYEVHVAFRNRPHFIHSIWYYIIKMPVFGNIIKRFANLKSRTINQHV